jgi:hypothetical protein
MFKIRMLIQSTKLQLTRFKTIHVNSLHETHNQIYNIIYSVTCTNNNYKTFRWNIKLFYLAQGCRKLYRLFRKVTMNQRRA